MNVKEEVWRPISGYEGRYDVSSFGRVRSLPKSSRKGTRIIRGGLNTMGYQQVILYKKDGTRHMAPVHRLVATEFIQNKNGFPCVNHRDENPTNNHVENLEWCDYKYNANYGTRNERLSKTQMEHPWLEQPIYRISLDGTVVEQFKNTKDAMRRTGVDRRNFMRCVNGHRKSCKGFRWYKGVA